MDNGNFYQPLLPFEEIESFETQSATSVRIHRWHLLKFSFWIDESIAVSELSQHWLTHTIKREEIYLDEQEKQRRRILVQAEDYGEQRILQQLHKYGDKAELVSPPELREKMRKEVARMYNYYQK